MEKVLIDTSVFIGLARKEPAAKVLMERVKEAEVLFCDIVLAEVLAGARNHDEFKRLHQHILKTYSVLPFTTEVSEHFRRILAETPSNGSIHISDQLIAAIALAHDCKVLTLNRKHFQGIKGLSLIA